MRPLDTTPFELKEEFKTVKQASLNDNFAFLVLERVHIKLTKTKQKQNGNKSEIEQEQKLNYSPQTHPTNSRYVLAVSVCFLVHIQRTAAVKLMYHLEFQRK
jgi:hypothetical protein